MLVYGLLCVVLAAWVVIGPEFVYLTADITAIARAQAVILAAFFLRGFAEATLHLVDRAGWVAIDDLSISYCYLLRRHRIAWSDVASIGGIRDRHGLREHTVFVRGADRMVFDLVRNDGRRAVLWSPSLATRTSAIRSHAISSWRRSS